METIKQRKNIRNSILGDNITRRSRDNSWLVKVFFFYRHGNSPEKVATQIMETLRKIGVKVEVLEKHEYWNQWPKNSWFEVRFKVI